MSKKCLKLTYFGSIFGPILALFVTNMFSVG